MRLYSFNIKEDSLEKLQKIANDKGLSVSALIRLILVEYIRDYYNE